MVLKLDQCKYRMEETVLSRITDSVLEWARVKQLGEEDVFYNFGE